MRLFFAVSVALSMTLSAQAQIKSDRYVPPKGEPKNIVIMIGHGMGMDELTAALIKNNGSSNFSEFPVVGFINPVSKGKVISAPLTNVMHIAYGDSIYVTKDGNVMQKGLFDWAKEKNMKTAMIVTGSVTDKVPAAFLSPQLNVTNEEAVKLYLEKDVDFIAGGGAKYFGGTGKEKNLLSEYYAKNYDVQDKLKKIGKLRGNKVLALVDDDKFYSVQHRKDYLSKASTNILSLLRGGAMYGFLAVIESDQIARAAEENNLGYLTGEVQDFDQAVGDVLNLFGKDDQTLVIVLGDGEYGGMNITGGNASKGTVEGGFAAKSNTVELMPLFAIGPGSQEFMGIYSSSEVYKKILGFIENRK